MGLCLILLKLGMPCFIAIHGRPEKEEEWIVGWEQNGVVGLGGKEGGNCS